MSSMFNFENFGFNEIFIGTYNGSDVHVFAVNGAKFYFSDGKEIVDLEQIKIIENEIFELMHKFD